MIEPFVINQQSSDVTQTDTTAATMSTWMSYRVPKGEKIILRPEDEICIYAADTGAAALDAFAPVKVILKDATDTEETPLVQSIQYGSYNGEFRDRDKIIKLDIAHEIIVGEQEYIKIQIKDTTGADKDTGYFEIRCHREV